MTTPTPEVVEACARAYLREWNGTVEHPIEWRELSDEGQSRVKKCVVAAITAYESAKSGATP